MKPTYQNTHRYIVLMAASIISFVCGGILQSFGILMVEFLETFGHSKSFTALIISIFIGLMSLSGTLAGPLANKYGCHTSAVLGALIAAVGAYAGSFADSLLFLLVTIGGIMGTGFGLLFCPTVIIVNMYFTRSRSFACGLVACASGLGTFTWGPFVAYLIDSYVWRGTLWITAGLLLNCVPMGLLYTLPKKGEIEKELEEIEAEALQTISQHGNSEVETPNLQKIKSPQEIQEPLSKPKFPSRQRLVTLSTAGSNVSLNQQIKPFDRKDVFLSGSLLSVYLDNPHDLVKTDPNGLEYCAVTNAKPGMPMKSAVQSRSMDSFVKREPSFKQQQQQQQQKQLECISERENEEMEAQRKMSLISPIVPPTDELVTNFPEDKQKSAITQISELLRNPVFAVLIISTFLTNLGYDLPRLFLPDWCEQMGHSKSESSWLISTWGISNTVGRIIVGYCCDRRFLRPHRIWVYNISLMLCGIFNCFGFFIKSYVTFVMFTCVIGITLSTHVSLISVIMVDMLGLEKLTGAFAIFLLSQGLGSMFGPPIGGMISDYSGGYGYCFLYVGLVIFLSGAIMTPVPFFIKFTSSKEKQKNTDENIADRQIVI